METNFSKFSTGFRKNHNIQYKLLRMISNWKTQLNNPVIIIHLPKAFDTLNAASFIKSYLTNRYQRYKIGDSFSEWERIIAGVPQRCILGPLVFNIFINDIFLYIENSDFCNYPDDSTLYAPGESLSIITEHLKADFLRISRWFHEYHIINIIL